MTLFELKPNSEYFETIAANENQQENQDVKQVCVCRTCICVPLQSFFYFVNKT